MVSTVTEYQVALREVSRLAEVDLEVLWRQVATGDLAREILAEVLPELARVYGGAAGTLSAEWYEELREAAGVDGVYRARVVPLPTADRFESLARWSVEPMFGEVPDALAALLRAQGGLQRTITNVGRGTIIGAALADPGAEGWSRRASSSACGFCRMLADRGAVYSKASVDFGAHDHCGCVAVPEFGGDAIAADRKVVSTRNISDADRARTRDWMRRNGY